MGTKRPSCTLFDTSNINTSDRKLQPGGKISRDPSPRPAMTAQSERERDARREEDRRREREVEKTRDKARYRDMDPRERYYERDRGTAPRSREGERDMRVRERWQEDDRSKSGRPLSNIEKLAEREVERGMKKGDTFPRIRKSSPYRDRTMTATTEMGKERRQRRVETDERERARQREWFRERERDEIRSRAAEEWKRRPAEEEKSRQRERYEEYDVSRQDRREAVDSWDRRERDVDRKREKLRPNMGEREARVHSAQRRRDREIHSDRRERGKRDTRSEGDSDERELKRERARDREREELTYQHSRSEGDNGGITERERDRDRRGDREEDRQRYRDKDREREADRSRRRGVEKEERYREEERWRESVRDVKDDRREDDRNREYKQKRGKDRDPRWDDSTGKGSRPQSEMAPRVPPRAQSSGEWSTTESDRDVEEQRAAERSCREKKRGERQERDRGEMRGGVPEQRKMWLEPQRGRNSKDEFVDRERQTRGNERRREEERNMETWAERGREGGRVKEEPNERYGGRHGGRSECRGDVERESEGVSVDGEEVGGAWREVDKGGEEQLSDNDGRIEGSRQRDVEGQNLTDNTEESDREEEGGSDYWVRSESEGGSEMGWKQDRDRMLSGEDGFVTVSSGGDEEDEREEEEEEEFKDCQEFWEVAHGDVQWREADDKREEERTMGKEETVEDDEQGREKKYVFCVIGQTLPRSKKSLSQDEQTMGVERDNPNLENYDATLQPQDNLHPTQSRDDEYPIINNQDVESRSQSSMPREERATEEDIRMRPKKEHPYAEIGPINRDSQTERLLMAWREKSKEDVEIEQEQPSPSLPRNPYADVFSQVNFEQIQPILDGLKTAVMSPEEVEAIRIRLSGAWTMSDEPKRHSQAPHLKWAKNVVREILGRSEDNTVDEANEHADQGVNQTAMEYEEQQEVAQEPGETPVVKLRTDEQHSEPELGEEEPLEEEGLRGMGQSQADMHADQFSAMHGDTPTHTHADTLLDTEGKEDQSMDKETEPSVHLQLEEADTEVKISKQVELSEREKEARKRREKEVEMYLSVSNTLYKPNSCPILNYEPESASGDSEGQEVEDRMVESEEERQGEEPEERGVSEDGGEMKEGEGTELDSREGEVAEENKVKAGTLMSTCSFRDLGPEARIRRRGIRKTTERRNGEHVEVEEAEGVGRDRRTRIFSTTGKESNGDAAQNQP